MTPEEAFRKFQLVVQEATIEREAVNKAAQERFKAVTQPAWEAYKEVSAA
jgi:hypothetical protein